MHLLRTKKLLLCKPLLLGLSRLLFSKLPLALRGTLFISPSFISFPLFEQSLLVFKLLKKPRLLLNFSLRWTLFSRRR